MRWNRDIDQVMELFGTGRPALIMCDSCCDVGTPTHGHATSVIACPTGPTTLQIDPRKLRGRELHGKSGSQQVTVRPILTKQVQQKCSSFGQEAGAEFVEVLAATRVRTSILRRLYLPFDSSKSAIPRRGPTSRSLAEKRFDCYLNSVLCSLASRPCSMSRLRFCGGFVVRGLASMEK
jgi:hypothetical protein